MRFARVPERPPHPALRADLSPKGRGKDVAPSHPSTTPPFGGEVGRRSPPSEVAFRFPLIPTFFALIAALVFTASPASAIVLGGPNTGAPQSLNCQSAGGTEDGSFCVLPNGDSCDSMKLFRDSVCEDPAGNILEEADYGTNLPPDDTSSDDPGTNAGDGDTQ
jgi:hypothetical protein